MPRQTAVANTVAISDRLWTGRKEDIERAINPAIGGTAGNMYPGNLECEIVKNARQNPDQQMSNQVDSFVHRVRQRWMAP